MLSIKEECTNTSAYKNSRYADEARSESVELQLKIMPNLRYEDRAMYQNDIEQISETKHVVRMTVDMSELQYINIDVLPLLFHIHRIARHKKIPLALEGACENVYNYLKLIKLNSFFDLATEDSIRE